MDMRNNHFPKNAFTVLRRDKGAAQTIIGIVPALTENMVLNIATAVITALTVLGVLVDPTTAGIGDSKLAQTYNAPRKDDFSEEGFEE